MDTTNQTLSNAAELTGRSNWLQLFADEVPAGGGGGIPDSAPATAPAPAVQPAQAPAQAPEVLDFGGRKISKTPETEALLRDWQNQSATITRQQQDLLRYRATGQTQAQPAAQPQAPSQAAAQQQMASLLGNLTPQQKEAFSTAFYGDDPLGALEQYVLRPFADQFSAQMMAPVQQMQTQMQFERSVADLASRHEDFNQVMPEMQKILDEQPGLANLQNGLEIVYQAAKTRSTQGAPAPQDPMKDPTVRQHYLQDPEIRKTIIEEHLRSVAGGQAPPPVLGAQPAPSAAPIAPADKPKSMTDATNQALAWIASQG